jgi:hypothetical protein
MTQKGHLNKPTLRMKIGSVKRNIFNKVDPKTLDWQYPIHKSISRLNACATLISKEVALIAKKGNPKISQIPFAMVSSLNDFVFDETVAKNKILVGNSADPATNQYEVLKKLSSIQVLDEVIVPLSYGNADYKTELIKATKNFHLKLNVLTDLLPKAEYYKLLSEVRVAIFPHKIQKAFGNIIALLYFGAKVFLRECNPIYYELNKIGVVVFPINSGLTKNDLEALSPELANKNRTLINNWIGEAKVKSYYNKLLSY